MDRLPLFQFSRDLCGYHYIQGSKLNEEMADCAERVFHAWLDTRNKFRKRVKLAAIIPRKGRKSTIITQSGPAYLLAHDPNLAIVIDSEQRQRSCDFLSATARIISGETATPWVQYLGNWRAKSDETRTWREDRLVIGPRTYTQRKEPSLGAISVEVGYTGGAPDAIFIDDPMSPESHTEVWMTNVTTHYDGLGPVLMPNGLFVLCMTRYDDADLYGHIERQEGVHVCEAVEMENCIRAGQCTHSTEDHPEPWHVLMRRAEDDQANSIDEVVWPTSFLRAEKKKYPGFYSAQYLNNPWHNPDASFQPEDFTYCKPEEVPQDVVKILSSDIAWKIPTDRKTERGGDWNVFVVGAHQRSTGKVYITHIGRGRWTQGEWGDELVHILRREKTGRVPISRMTYEELRGGAAGALADTVKAACTRWRELAPALVVAPRSTSPDAKQERVKSIAMYFQNHQCIFVRPCGNTDLRHAFCDKPGCKEFYTAMMELLKYGATLHDDCADALADQFVPEVYIPPSVNIEVKQQPLFRPYDDILKPYQNELGDYIQQTDDHGRVYWVPTDRLYRREPV